jgi:eukaryotic-like serine/threonine-protein kinase
MALATGTRLGPYEILAGIGAGGMGEVYRARDSKLGRDVALKVLPEAFARDAERMARFQREAKVLASLNHPNIASIYGLEDSGATHALVMELVEGPTLADRIRSGPIPLDEALRIAKQITEALEYAHERGIVHRDLKPANVKVTSDDAVKVLDFGLAKAIEPRATSPESIQVGNLLHRMEKLLGEGSSIADIEDSPTLSDMATRAGVLLGTAAYMSPEQAKGKAADRRADIWAFGCVLYEMLSGKMTFRGETMTETLAAVLKSEPDWSQLPEATPIRVRLLLNRCLRKDPKQRLQAIGDARISIEEVLDGAPEPSLAGGLGIPTPPWHRAAPWGVAALLFLALAPIAFIHFREKLPAPAEPMRFEVPLPEKTTYTSDSVVVSPDGHKFAFVATGSDGIDRLWVRSLDALETRVLEGTEGANGYPIWSPDSRQMAFSAHGELRKIEASGGPTATVCDTQVAWGGTWLSDDTIVFGAVPGTLRVPASGGSPVSITTGGNAITPSFLPDGKHFVYWAGKGENGQENDGIYLGSLDAKPDAQRLKKLLPDYSGVVYVPSSDPAVGYLVFERGTPFGTLMAQAFDNRRLELTGEAIPIAERVAVTSFSASAGNVLVYASGEQTAPGTQGQLTWFDREGKVLGTVGDPGEYPGTLALSPDGKRVAFDRLDLLNNPNRDLWLYDFARGVTTRITFDPSWNSRPVWSPDGSHIAFASNRGGQFDLYQKASNLAGEDELMFKSNTNKVPSGWSPDGRFLLYDVFDRPSQLWLLPLGVQEVDRKPFAIEHSEFDESWGQFSPDGRWISYVSNESGRNEIYVRPFNLPSAGSAATTGKWMVSKDGGKAPRWRRDGKELFFLSLDGSAMGVDVNTSGEFHAGIPKVLFKVPPGVTFWDVTADGKRFLMAAPSAAGAPPKFVVVLNWQAGLKK